MSFLGKLVGRDSLRDLEEAATNLGFLSDAEMGISKFYRQCAETIVKDKDFWNSLADEEVMHAESARKMAELITRHPTLYKPGTSFVTSTIRMFSLEMQNLAERMSKGQISSDELFAIALEIEDSAMEISYSKIIRSEEKLYISLAQQIDSGSASHKARILSRAPKKTAPEG
jgi:hypothetical protein